MKTAASPRFAEINANMTKSAKDWLQLGSDAAWPGEVEVVQV